MWAPTSGACTCGRPGAACRRRLEYHGLTEKLAIGTVGGMPQTVELFATADRVVAPC